MMTRDGLRFALAVGLLVASGAASAQKTPANLAFEVATVKPSPPLDMAKLAAAVRAGRMPRFGPHVDGALAIYTYMSLKQLIANAYGVKAYQIIGPAWLATQRFDVVAKIPAGASKDDAPQMLQALLEDRFKLAAHHDTQLRPVLALVVGKHGPKLKESPPDTAPVDMNAPLKPGETRTDTPNGPVRMTRNADGSMTMNMGQRGIMTVRFDPQAHTMTLQSSRVTMSGFADMLTNMLRMGGGGGRQVVDMTGLKGNYQVAVELSLSDLIAAAKTRGMMIPPAASTSTERWGASPAAAASEPGGGSTVFESVNKLGLKLEPRKASVQELVIDHIEKAPTEN
jgi:uncharacterized protein (TIGR03435 family)